MSDIINSDKNIAFTLGNDKDIKYIYSMARALASYERLEIMRLLIKKPMNIYSIAKALNLPKSTVSDHIAVLEDAQILFVSTEQGVKRHVKMCNNQLNELIFKFHDENANRQATPIVSEIPVGLFTEADISAPCGMYVVNTHKQSDNGKISQDAPLKFFDPRRRNAELIWFSRGFVSYRVPNELYLKKISKLELSFECCSEITYHKNDWPSDISVKINDLPVLTLLSPGDFGGRRGKYSPEAWGINSTQYGLLYRITIDKSGTYLNDVPVNKQTLDDFSLEQDASIKISFGVEEDAVHRGGINLFGKKFGDYNQSILLTLHPDT